MTGNCDPDKSPYISVYKSLVGWKAVMVVWDEDDDIWEPYQTGVGFYETEREALKEARAWARDEGIRLSPKITDKK